MRRCGPLLLLVAACASKGPMPVASHKPALAEHFAPAVADRLAASLEEGCVLVSDADGTLWFDDIGEAFLRHLVATKALVSPEARGIDVWASYEARVREDRAAGYAWAVQVMAGLPEAEVRRLAEAFAVGFVAENAYPGMRALVAEARARGCTPWIVSASNQWIIEAAAPHLGIEKAHTVGIRVAVKEGTLTDEVVAPVTYAGGKVEAIAKYIGKTPAIVAGDSSGDVDMMAIATGAALWVDHRGRTAVELVSTAREKGWLVQDFGR